MKKNILGKIFIAIIIIIIASFGGVILGNIITPDAESAAREKKWVSLGIPPEAAVKIAGESECGQTYEVVVQSASGKNYIFCSSEWKPWQNGSGGPWELYACQGDPPAQYSPSVKNLPYPVKDCVLKFTSEWAIDETVYSVLEDGSVWKWHFTYSIGTIISYWFGGLIFGLIVGIMISVRVWRGNEV
ncbi:MAG: hypothetical protein JW908_15735 [Anaerolineales bacterium]|nr:hypothetical protein [Anaerolineales bacterium]